MQTDSIELGFLSIFALITFFIFLIINNYSSKISNGIFLDDDFNKVAGLPQHNPYPSVTLTS